MRGEPGPLIMSVLSRRTGCLGGVVCERGAQSTDHVCTVERTGCLGGVVCERGAQSTDHVCTVERTGWFRWSSL